MGIRRSVFAAQLALSVTGGLVGCGNRGNPVTDDGTPSSASAPAAAPLDANAITEITGGTPETAGDAVKINFPRTDPSVQIDGWKNVPPYMGLTSYVAFLPRAKDQAMAMGDFVLFEDEVNPAMSAALDHGLEVTALHNHFFFDTPKVYFMHVMGMGSIEAIGGAVRAMMDTVASVRQGASAPRETFGRAPISGPSHVDAAKLDVAFGVKGKTKDGMYKATFGRTVTSATCGGCTVGGAMGINTWAAVAGSDDDAVVDGDFAVTEDELQSVLRTLRGGGVDVVAIHSHTMRETPRILFLHYWGRGSAADLAKIVKTAVDKTAWDGR